MKRYILSLAICLFTVLGLNAQKVACATNVIQIVNGKGVSSQKNIKNSGLSLLKKSSGQYVYGNNVEIVNGAVKPLNNHACYLNISNARTMSAVIYFKNKVDANKFWNELMSQSYVQCKGSDNLYEKVHNNVVYHVVQKAVYKNGWYTINLNAKRPVLNDRKTGQTGKKTTVPTAQTNSPKTSQNKQSAQGAKTTRANAQATHPAANNLNNGAKTKTYESKTPNTKPANTTTNQSIRFTPESPKKN